MAIVSGGAPRAYWCDAKIRARQRGPSN